MNMNEAARPIFDVVGCNLGDVSQVEGYAWAGPISVDGTVFVTSRRAPMVRLHSRQMHCAMISACHQNGHE